MSENQTTHHMTEEQNSAAVPTGSEGGAVPPTQAPSSEPTELQHKFDLLKADNLRKGQANEELTAQIRELQRQYKDLQNSQNKAKQQRLVENENFEQLWKDSNQTVSSLQSELEQLRKEKSDMAAAMQQAQIRTSVMNVFSQQGVHSPDQLFKLQQDNLRLKDGGEVVGFLGGVEVPLDTFVQQLKSPGSGFDFYFSGTGARGMGAVGSAPAATGQKPFDRMSLSERVALEVQDPQLYSRLKAQAAAG